MLHHGVVSLAGCLLSAPVPLDESIRLPRSAIEPGTLGVLSFNMQHRDRPAELAALAEGLRTDLERMPDFILCQEVLFDRAASKGEADTASVLANNVGYYCHGTRRTSDREGVAILSRHPFVYWSQLDLDTRTSVLLLGFRRISVMGEFLVPSIGRVRVVNVHLAYWGFEHHVRRKQLAETLDWMAQREREVHADVTVLGGDFNIEPGWSEMNQVTGPGLSSDPMFVNYNSTAPSRGARGNPSARVDYIFVSADDQRQVEFQQERLLYRDGLQLDDTGPRLWLSDHLPLLHEYVLTPIPNGPPA